MVCHIMSPPNPIPPDFDHLITNVEDVLRDYTCPDVPEVNEITLAEPEPFIVEPFIGPIDRTESLAKASWVTVVGPLNRTSEDPVPLNTVVGPSKDPTPPAKDPPTDSEIQELVKLECLLTKIQTTMKLFEEHSELLRTDLRDIYCEMVVFLKKDGAI